MQKRKEIVFYEEQHTMMWQEVTVKINEEFLKEALNNELSDYNKKELIQTYYLLLLRDDVPIVEKTNYGSWNAAIGDLSSIHQYKESIINKIKGFITLEEIEKEIKIVNKICGLNDSEIQLSLHTKGLLLKELGMNGLTLKP